MSAFDISHVSPNKIRLKYFRKSVNVRKSSKLSGNTF